MTRGRLAAVWSGIGVLAGSLLCISIAAQTSAPPAAPQAPAESSNMALLGYNDLQGRAAYQPVIIQQGNRWIVYIGHHGATALNPMTGVNEPNGTSVLDVTDPRNPKYLAHIPGGAATGSGPREQGGAQMVRVCSGSELPRADKSRFYMLRAFGNSAHELWDVTDPAKPVRLTVIVDGLRDTHKNWWECDTGIAYLVGGPPGWSTPRIAQIYDLSEPTQPVFIRDFGMPGQQPGSSGTADDRLHGPMSTGPRGNRVYFPFGNITNGVFLIVDRDKLLSGPKEPTDGNLLYPVIARVDLPRTIGAHSSFPLLEMPLPAFANEPREQVKDFLAVVGEAGAGGCDDYRQTLRVFDITSETRPFGVSTWLLPEGDFCGRGGRFGTHAPNESFTPVYYNRVLFLSHFSAGVRAVDIRNPYQPKEIAYYIPVVTNKTQETCNGEGATQRCNAVIQTNGVEVDDRGYIYITDRVGTGLHILELTGSARQAADLP